MTLSDSIIAQDGLDWSEMLETWDWALPPSCEVWIVTRFADLIIVQEDGSVWVLDTSGGTYKRFADSRDHFGSLMNDMDRFADLFLVHAVDNMVKAGHRLGPQQCYTFKQPPGLGGAYDLTNFTVTDISVHLGLHGQIFGQIKDCPDGTKVTLKMVLSQKDANSDAVDAPE